MFVDSSETLRNIVFVDTLQIFVVEERRSSRLTFHSFGAVLFPAGHPAARGLQEKRTLDLSENRGNLGGQSQFHLTQASTENSDTHRSTSRESLS